jgi:hypothetical protein
VSHDRGDVVDWRAGGDEPGGVGLAQIVKPESAVRVSDNVLDRPV